MEEEGQSKFIYHEREHLEAALFGSTLARTFHIGSDDHQGMAGKHRDWSAVVQVERWMSRVVVLWNFLALGAPYLTFETRPNGPSLHLSNALKS